MRISRPTCTREATNFRRKASHPISKLCYKIHMVPVGTYNTKAIIVQKVGNSVSQFFLHFWLLISHNLTTQSFLYLSTYFVQYLSIYLLALFYFFLSDLQFASVILHYKQHITPVSYYMGWLHEFYLSTIWVDFNSSLLCQELLFTVGPKPG